ncbi:LuxR C-terminal-related transcriptional regulator [Mycolicibacterium sp. CBMA 226]|nr:LuxR C-terminal-related transcriptional regulator [Mycolicibacterium sp. CBMA 226]
MLNLGESTVKFHVARILKKLRVNTRGKPGRWAWKLEFG